MGTSTLDPDIGVFSAWGRGLDGGRGGRGGGGTPLESLSPCQLYMLVAAVNDRFLKGSPSVRKNARDLHNRVVRSICVT